MMLNEIGLENIWIRGISRPMESFRDISKISLMALYTFPLLVLTSVLIIESIKNAMILRHRPEMGKIQFMMQ